MILCSGRARFPGLLSLGATLLGACEPAQPTLPEGLLIQGEAEAARAVLAQLQGLEGTPAAATAATLTASLQGCEATFSLIRPPGAESSAPRCAADPALAGLPQGHPLAFALPAAAPGRLVGHVEPGPTLKIEATLRDPVEAGAWGLLLPSAQSPGPLVLNDERELVHLRARAARVSALSELVEQGGQGDAMFGLKSALFAGAVLDGTWEFAAWLPPEGEQLPLAALAVGVRDEGLALSALEGWVEQLESTWNIALSRDAADLVGCFRALNTLPGLAPCGAIRDGALLVGWNEQSLRHALARPAGTPVESALGRVALERFPEADRLLSLAFAPEEPPPTARYPWRSLTLSATRGEDALDLHLEAIP